MQHYKGYVIVSDLDGTLIDSKHNISKENIDAISSYVKKGGLFAVATGRTEINVKPYIKDLEINFPCILYNGAIIYDNEKKQFIKGTYLDNKYLLEPLKEILGQYKNLCMQIFSEGKMFITSGMDTLDPVVIKEGQPYEFASIDDIAEQKWIKIIFNDTNAALKSIQQFLNNSIPPGIISTVFSTSTYLELLAYGVSKGSALSDLTEILGIERQKVIAIGDYCNDIEMIKAAGVGAATANAHPLLKEAADITAVSNDEHAIQYLIKKVIPDLEQSLHEDKNTIFSPGSTGYSNVSL